MTGGYTRYYNIYTVFESLSTIIEYLYHIRVVLVYKSIIYCPSSSTVLHNFKQCCETS